MKHEHDNENEKSFEIRPPVFQQSQSLPIPNSGPGLAPTSTSISTAEPYQPFPPSPSLSPSPIPIAVSRSSNGPVGRITDRWTEQGQVPVIIGVRPVGSSTSSSSLKAEEAGSGAEGFLSSSSEHEPLKSQFGGSMGMVGRRALPGLVSTSTSTPTPGAGAFSSITDANTSGRGVPLTSRTSSAVSSSQHSESTPSASVSVSPTTPSASISTSAVVSKYPFSSSSPSEPTRPTAATPSSRPITKPNTRIPSTGNRATVMDVAQAFGVDDGNSDLHAQKQTQSWSLTDIGRDSSAAVLAPEWEKDERLEEKEVEEEEEEEYPEDPEPLTQISLKSGSALRQNTNVNNNISTSTSNISNPYQHQPSTFISSLQRRSSYNEKYSAIASALPPLKEEATPIPTPVGTLRSGSVLDGSRGENRNGSRGGGLSVGDDEVDRMNGAYGTDVRDRDGARMASEVSGYASDMIQISKWGLVFFAWV